MDSKKKTPAEQSAVTTRYVVMPNQANAHGTAFGGDILSWIDVVASMVAQRYCCKQVVTAQIDSVSFLMPIQIGEHVILKSSVNYTGKTSLEVGVIVYSENPLTGIRQRATKAYLTFVAIDDSGSPVSVKELVPENEEEKRRHAQAKERVSLRKQRRTK